MILPSYFSTGKTKLLTKRVETLANLGKNVAYVVCVPYWGDDLDTMALTLQMEEMFRKWKNVEVIQIFVR